MPELPEVETVRRGLAQVMEGRVLTHVVVNRGDLRWPLPPDFVKRITGQTVQALGRRAKYLTLELSSGDILLAHLGMSGRMVIDPPGATPSEPGLYYRNLEANGLHEHVAFQVDSEEALTAAYFSLVDHDVKIARAVDHVSQKSVYFHDPDGNLLEIYHELPEAREMFLQGRHDRDVPLEFER